MRFPRVVAATLGSCVLLASFAVGTTSCPAGDPTSRAFQINDRAQLIGGPRALGEVGDWMLENDTVRFIIQDAGFSRGFGVFGGALLDADLVRTTSGRGSSDGGVGKDNFGEMFPAFFLEALNPNGPFDPNDPSTRLNSIEVENDGTDGKPAVVVVRGTGGDFIALTQTVNEVLLSDSRQNPSLFFETRYILEPGVNYIKMVTRVQNISAPARRVTFDASFGGEQIPTPFGDVVLFGAGNKVFTPAAAGFDIRFALEDIYASNAIPLPALPGINAEFVASAGKDVSYGLLAETPADGVENFVQANGQFFPGATDHDIHIPFIASAFTGVFQVLPPALERNDGQLGGADEMQFTRYFIVGDGDVSSISDTVYDLLGDKTGALSGRLRHDGAGDGLNGVSLVVIGADGKKVTQITTDEGGRFNAKLRPGSYSIVIVEAGYASKKVDDIVIESGKTTRSELTLPQPAQLVVTVVEEGKGRVPAKVTVVGTTPAEFAGTAADEWLFDLSVGEEFRFTDFVPDVAGDADTLKYIEHFDYTNDGTVAMTVRPGTYQVVVGRGIEYDRTIVDVTLKAGATETITATIKRTVDTTGYVGADFHLHSVFSLDSNANLPDRITSYAGEGIEYAVSTDHNFIVDYRPTIEKLGMSRFINTCTGLELTTIDRGHFNGFPLDRGDGALIKNEKGDVDTIASKTYGSFEWALRDPQDIFDDLRSRGRKGDSDTPGKIVLQVNHPRDTILGYFDQYGINADTLEVEGQSGLIAPDPDEHPEFDKEAFSFDFDAIEVFNGKRFEFLQTFRVPAGITVDPVSCCPVTPGEVLREFPGPNCGDEVPPELCGCFECSGANAAACEAFTVAQVAADKCNAAKFSVAFPGVVDDWLRLLETGKRVVGTANSDSHEADKEEPGSPRTYVRVPSDEPAQLSPDDILAAFDAGDALMTNGPFVRVSINDKGMGQTVSATGTVTLKVHVEQAPWVKADSIRIFLGSDLMRDSNGDPIITPVQHPVDDVEIPLEIDGDTFVVVEVASFAESASLFPSIFPNEVPPLAFTDVIGSLGASFGLGAVDGALEPELTFVTTPYALTNPIFVDGDGDGAYTGVRRIPGQDGFASVVSSRTAPQTGLTRPVVTVPTEAEAIREAERAAWEAMPLRKRKTLSRLPRWLWPSNDPRDVRRVFVQFIGHGH